jgi:nitroimidazol reductase NimA-like FMN-containing flavoprotein (pyridoxamine 5'-phosphate oxidase superfamily)
MVFTEPELEFLRSQRICRLATVGPTGWPHVVPVMYVLTEQGDFEFDAMGPKRGLTVQGRVELIGPERARLTGVRKFSWGL